MHSVSVLDRYTNKYLTVWEISPEDFANLKIWEKIVYGVPDPKTGSLKKSVGTIIELSAFEEKREQRESHREYQNEKLTGTYEKILQGEEKADFEEQQQIALKIFPTFKKDFKAEFPNSTPITARFQIFSNQLYFFFYSEERYIFTEFVKKFREKLGMNLFLFQVWARDMMRMSPGANGMFGNCGNQLCCKSNTVLPNIEIEAVIFQGLEGRDIEKLKGKCWKLKCCLLFELDFYVQESKKYPQKGTRISTCKTLNHCKSENCNAEECQGVVTSFNVITQEVSIRTKESFLRIPIEKLKIKK